MTPIINPMWFYLIDVLNTLDDIAPIFSFASAVAMVVFAFLWYVMWDDYYNEKKDISETEYKRFRKIASKFLKGSIIVFVISLFITVMVPAKKTMYTMMVVDQIKLDNIEGVEEAIKDSVDYIYCKFNNCGNK